MPHTQIHCLSFSDPIPHPPTPILFFYLNTSLSEMLTYRGVSCVATPLTLLKDALTVEAVRNALQKTLKAALFRETFFKPCVVLPATLLSSAALLVITLALTTIGLPLIAAYIISSAAIIVFVLSLIDQIIGKYADTVQSYHAIQHRAHTLLHALDTKTDPHERILLRLATQIPLSATQWETLC